MKPPRIEDVRIDVPWRGPVRISPQAAADTVGRLNIRNRRVRRNSVDYIRKMILTGQWQTDHPQPIVFSSERLIDGQHRLLGIEAAKVEVVAMCEFGVRDELRQYIDTGDPRRVEDRITFTDDLAANGRVARVLTYYLSMMSGHGTKATPEQYAEAFAGHRDAVMFAENFLLRAKRLRGLCKSSVAVALLEMYERDRDKAVAFANDLLDPQSINPHASLLRTTLMNMQLLRSSWYGRSDPPYGKSVSAMRAYMEGRPIKSLIAAAWR